MKLVILLRGKNKVEEYFLIWKINFKISQKLHADEISIHANIVCILADKIYIYNRISNP